MQVFFYTGKEQYINLKRLTPHVIFDYFLYLPATRILNLFILHAVNVTKTKKF